MSEIDKWLEINTFECPMGRVSPETCQKLRQRPTVSDLMNGKAGGTIYLRPTPCINCTDWERLAQEVYKKRKKFQEKKEKQQEGEMPKKIICPECGQEKPHYARGLCRRCYDKLRHKSRQESQEGIFIKFETSKDSIVLVDFSVIPELFEELKKRAKEELRSLNMQILWELKKSLQELEEKENKQ